MHITGFTIKQADQVIGITPIREQAVGAAKTRAQQTGVPVSVIARLDTGADREVIFHPDGTNERIWAIDKGQRIQPADNGPMFWNAAGGCSNASGVFQNIESGWTFTAKGVIQYIDGSIEWDHSVDGHFEQL